MIIIIREVRYKPLSIRAWMVIHLGKNPRKGGIPPNDRKFNENINFTVLLVIAVINCLIWKILSLSSIRTIEAEIMEYTAK